MEEIEKGGQRERERERERELEWASDEFRYVTKEEEDEEDRHTIYVPSNNICNFDNIANSFVGMES